MLVHRISDLWCWWVLVAAGRCQVHVVHINDDSSFRIETKAGRPTPLKHCLKLIHAVLDLVIGVLVSGDVAGLPYRRTELMRDIEKHDPTSDGSIAVVMNMPSILLRLSSFSTRSSPTLQAFL